MGDAQRSRAVTIPAALQGLIDEGLAAGDGEIILQNREHHDRIFISRGGVAWIGSSEGERTLSRVMERRGLATRAELRDTWLTCRDARSSFAETLAKNGVVPRASLEAAVLEHLALQLLRLLSRAGTGPMRFHPIQRTFSSGLVFSFEDILREASRCVSLVVPGRGARGPSARTLAPPPMNTHYGSGDTGEG